MLSVYWTTSGDAKIAYIFFFRGRQREKGEKRGDPPLLSSLNENNHSILDMCTFYGHSVRKNAAGDLIEEANEKKKRGPIAVIKF